MMFRIEILPNPYPAGRRYTSRIIRIRGGKIIWSSGSQLYTRKIDARREAWAFIRAAKADRVEIVA